MPIDLFLITGFLGAGKTTLLNSLVAGLGGRRAGLIVNEFGPVNIDALRIAAAGARPGAVIELNNGQIFCSCLAASFIDSVLSFADMPVDLLLVECSGLSRPAPLDTMVSEIEKRAGGRIAYRGMLCVADAETFTDLSQAAAAVSEQVVRSSVIILNKIDRVTPEEAERVARDLAALNPDARIVRSSFCTSGEDLLALAGAPATGFPSGHTPRGAATRPESVFLPAPGLIDVEELRAFIARIAGMAYRVKGLVGTAAGNRSVDSTPGSIKIAPWAGPVERPGLVVIARHGVPSGEIAREWERCAVTAAGRTV